jgi:hypothetical protein
MSKHEDYYRVLGVDRSATEEEIQDAFHKLALKYHPDVNLDDPQSEERFKRISAAYQVLSDVEERGRYDRQAEFAWHHSQQNETGQASATWGERGEAQPADVFRQWQASTQRKRPTLPLLVVISATVVLLLGIALLTFQEEIGFAIHLIGGIINSAGILLILPILCLILGLGMSLWGIWKG